MRLSRLAVLPLILSGLAACDSGPAPETSRVPLGQKAPAAAAAGAAPADASASGATPMAQRVATLGLLNKRNNVTQDLVLKVGEARRIGNLVVRLSTCERTLPWEIPPETGAFVQVYAEERADANADLAWRTVFSGWLFKRSPSLNVVEHPVYDVWVKDCAMSFPGEESPVATPTGRATGAPAPAASPAPAPSPSPTAEAADSTEA